VAIIARAFKEYIETIIGFLKSLPREVVSVVLI
jgi:hypothetical protein